VSKIQQPRPSFRSSFTWFGLLMAHFLPIAALVCLLGDPMFAGWRAAYAAHPVLPFAFITFLILTPIMDWSTHQDRVMRAIFAANLGASFGWLVALQSFDNPSAYLYLAFFGMLGVLCLFPAATWFNQLAKASAAKAAIAAKEAATENRAAAATKDLIAIVE
jgi:hypothetical protein